MLRTVTVAIRQLFVISCWLIRRESLDVTMGRYLKQRWPLYAVTAKCYNLSTIKYLFLHFTYIFEDLKICVKRIFLAGGLFAISWVQCTDSYRLHVQQQHVCSGGKDSRVSQRQYSSVWRYPDGRITTTSRNEKHFILWQSYPDYERFITPYVSYLPDSRYELIWVQKECLEGSNVTLFMILILHWSCGGHNIATVWSGIQVRKWWSICTWWWYERNDGHDENGDDDDENKTITVTLIVHDIVWLMSMWYFLQRFWCSRTCCLCVLRFILSGTTSPDGE